MDHWDSFRSGSTARLFLLARYYWSVIEIIDAFICILAVESCFSSTERRPTEDAWLEIDLFQGREPAPPFIDP